jgi:hypothetical protein
MPCWDQVNPFLRGLPLEWRDYKELANLRGSGKTVLRLATALAKELLGS